MLSPLKAEPYFDDPSIEDHIKKGLEHRKKVLEHLKGVVYTYLSTTMFWFFEHSEKPMTLPVWALITREVETMFLADMIQMNNLVPFDAAELREFVRELAVEHGRCMERKLYKSADGSTFILHTVIVRIIGSNNDQPYTHQVDKFSFTAGIGVVPWDHYSAIQMDSVKDFIFNVAQGCADHTVPPEMKVTDARYTCVFPLRTDAHMPAKEPS